MIHYLGMEDKCHFCGKPEEGYARREDGASGNSKYFDACEKCAAKPYPAVHKVNTANKEEQTSEQINHHTSGT
jgi:hypothetical protein